MNPCSHQLISYYGRLLRTHLFQIVNDSTGQLACQTIQRFLATLARQLVFERLEDVAATL